MVTTTSVIPARDKGGSPGKRQRPARSTTELQGRQRGIARPLPLKKKKKLYVYKKTRASFLFLLLSFIVAKILMALHMVEGSTTDPHIPLPMVITF